MSKTVLLWHSGQGHRPGGVPDHFDWLIERPDVPGRGLLTFRVPVRIDLPECIGFHAEHIGDHRTGYLAYEGPVSGGRGEVHRVASGECQRLVETETLMEAVAVFGGRRITYTGRLAGGVWVFSVAGA